MMPDSLILLSVAALLITVATAAFLHFRQRNLHLWVPSYFRQSARRRLSRGRRPQESIDVLLCIADHFEPAWGNASAATADARVAAWIRDYPCLLGGFQDSDGRPPRHTLFYPIDQYEKRHVDALAGLCRDGFGEIEIHLHHDHDTAENLELTLRRWSQLFAERHGLLGRWADGRIAYGFVHGNWALDNSRPDGRWCGVNNELDVLQRTGCYADFTLPSAPDSTQTQKINSIYYAVGHSGCCKSHNHGTDVGSGPPSPDALMLIQGPLRLWWPKHSWKPRIENGCIQQSQPLSTERLNQWLRAGVRVSSRPDWVFVKLHTHGAIEANRQVLLGEGAARFHRSLAQRAADDHRFRFHYVTAREMYNLAKAAEAGWEGPVMTALDFVIRRPPIRPAELCVSGPVLATHP